MSVKQQTRERLWKHMQPDQARAASENVAAGEYNELLLETVPTLRRDTILWVWEKNWAIHKAGL